MATVVDPPKLLAAMLREDRARGLAFDDVWAEDVACAISGVSTRSSWRRALEGMQRAFRDAWHGWPGPALTLTPDLGHDSHELRPTSPVPSPVPLY